MADDHVSKNDHFPDEWGMLATTIFDHCNDGIIITDGHGSIIRVNAAFCRITGFSVPEAVGETPRILHSGRQNKRFYKQMWDRLQKHGHWQGEIWNRRKNGEIYPEWLSINSVRGGQGNTSHYVGIFTDISSKKHAEKIHRLAFYDSLTGLPSRPLLEDRLKLALAGTHRSSGRTALLFVDLDNFKRVNDSLGHAIGDALLKEAAARFTKCIREGDTVARLGGDEFVVLLPALPSCPAEAAQAAATVAGKIERVMCSSMLINGHEIVVTTSTGIALSPDDADNADGLLRNADAAMYHAKKQGRNNYQFYAAGMNTPHLDQPAYQA